jgi:hypothetical protein
MQSRKEPDPRALGMVETIRKNFKGTLMVAGGFLPDTAAQWIREGKADLIAFGRKFIANPDLPELASKGRCPTCQGEGFVCVDLLFLPSVHAPCPSCHGARFSRHASTPIERSVIRRSRHYEPIDIGLIFLPPTAWPSRDRSSRCAAGELNPRPRLARTVRRRLQQAWPPRAAPRDPRALLRPVRHPRPR